MKGGGHLQGQGKPHISGFILSMGDFVNEGDDGLL